MPSRVVIVEDNPVTGTLLQVVLENGGYDADLFETAEEALEHAFAAPPDLILMDLNLGSGMSGIEAIEALKADDSTADVPVVVVTGLDDEEARRSAVAAGCEGYLRKPVVRAALVEKVSEIVPPS